MAPDPSHELKDRTLWVTYSKYDGCAYKNIAAFDDEVKALRCAVEHKLEVTRIPYGADLAKWLEMQANSQARKDKDRAS